MSSPTVTRASLLGSAGSLIYDAASANLAMFCKEAINVTLEKETWRPTLATHGEDAPRLKDATAEIKFTPSGRITSDIISLLYPSTLQNPVLGSRLFPASDKELIVHGMDGTQLKFASVAPFQMPDLVLSPAETAIGEAVFKAVIKDNTSRETAGSLYSTASVAWSGTFDPSTIITCPYNVTYGDTPIHTKDGIKVSFDVQVAPIYVDGIGTVDWKITGVQATATFTPHDMSITDIMGAHAPEQALGSNLRQSKNLVVTADTVGGINFTLYDCVLDNGDVVYQTEEPRAGELAFVANRQLSGSGEATTLGALFSLTIRTV